MPTPTLLPRCYLGGGRGGTAPYPEHEKQHVSSRSWGGSQELGQGRNAGRGCSPTMWGIPACSGAGGCLYWSSQPGSCSANACTGPAMLFAFCSVSQHPAFAVPLCFQVPFHGYFWGQELPLRFPQRRGVKSSPLFWV